MEGNKTLVLEIRMVLDLVDAWWDRGCSKGGFEVRLQVIGYADRSGFAGALDLLHLGPGVLEVFVRFGVEWGMDKIPRASVSEPLSDFTSAPMKRTNQRNPTVASSSSYR